MDEQEVEKSGLRLAGSSQRREREVSCKRNGKTGARRATLRRTDLAEGENLGLPVVVAVEHELALAADRLGMRMSCDEAVEHGQLMQVALGGEEGRGVLPAGGRGRCNARQGRAEG